jgi:hypothetical protein
MQFWGLIHKVSLASNHGPTPTAITHVSPGEKPQKTPNFREFSQKMDRIYVEYGQFSTRVFAESGDKLIDV